MSYAPVQVRPQAAVLIMVEVALNYGGGSLECSGLLLQPLESRRDDLGQPLGGG